MFSKILGLCKPAKFFAVFTLTISAFAFTTTDAQAQLVVGDTCIPDDKVDLYEEGPIEITARCEGAAEWEVIVIADGDEPGYGFLIIVYSDGAQIFEGSITLVGCSGAELAKREMKIETQEDDLIEIEFKVKEDLCEDPD